MKARPFHCLLFRSRTFQWEDELAHFAEKWEEINRQQNGSLSIVRNGFRIPFIKIPPLSSVSDQNESILLPVSQRRDRKSSQQTGSGKGYRIWELPAFIPGYSLCQKKNGKFRLILDLSLLNCYIEKQAFKMETIQIGKTSDGDSTIELSP